MTRKQRQLRERIRANCNPITGLTPQEYERHIRGIVRLVEGPHHANGRRRRP